jgi:hypothetical protein
VCKIREILSILFAQSSVSVGFYRSLKSLQYPSIKLEIPITLGYYSLYSLVSKYELLEELNKK